MHGVVYRVQDGDGEGPYNYDYGKYDFNIYSILNHQYSKPRTAPKHMSPFDDPKLNGIEENEYCGFDTLKHLRRYFTKNAMKELKKHGFGVYKIRPHYKNKIRKGLTQVVFVRNEKDKVELIEIGD